MVLSQAEAVERRLFGERTVRQVMQGPQLFKVVGGAGGRPNPIIPRESSSDLQPLAVLVTLQDFNGYAAGQAQFFVQFRKERFPWVYRAFFILAV
jgi:hypothetical protein